MRPTLSMDSVRLMREIGETDVKVAIPGRAPVVREEVMTKATTSYLKNKGLKGAGTTPTPRGRKGGRS